MNRSTHSLRAVAAAGTLGIAAVLALGVSNPAAAEPAWTAGLFVGGGGLSVDHGDGTVTVEGPALVQDKHLRDMLDATIRATLAVADSTLPALGECEPASATFVVEGERDADMTLTSQGTVCRVSNSYFPAYITIEFNGLHEVIEAKRPQLRGAIGSLSMLFTPGGGFASLHADSFVPSA